MSNLQKFNFEQNEVQTVLINEELYFIGKEISTILGYSNYRDALNNHVDPEDKLILTSQNTTLEKVPNRGLIGINESGLFSLVIGSKLPAAKKFKRWVTKEVLPSIRKNGMYATDELLDNPDLLIAAATKLKEERALRLIAEQQVTELKPKALFADAVATSHTSILVGELAKIIKQNGVDIGANRLFHWLRANGFLIKRKGTDWNMPTQKSMELGLFEVKETAINRSDGSVSVSKTAKVTGKGQQYFINKFLNHELQLA